MQTSIQLIRHSDNEKPRGLVIKDINNIFYSQNWEIKITDSTKTYISPYFVHPALKIFFKLEINDENIKYYIASADYNIFDKLYFYFIFSDPSNPNTNIYSVKKDFTFTYSSHFGYFTVPIPEKSLGDQLNIYFELHYQMPKDLSDDAPIFNKGNVGLLQEHNLCFMNSSLQIFYHIPLFRTILYSFDASKIKGKKVLLNTVCLFREMEESVIPCSAINVCFSIDFFKNNYKEQQDVTEFITRWFDCLTNEMSETEQEAQLNNLFGFTTNSIIETAQGENNSPKTVETGNGSEFSMKGENNSSETVGANDDSLKSTQNKTRSVVIIQPEAGLSCSTQNKVEDNSNDNLEYSIQTKTEFNLSLNVPIRFNSEEEKNIEHDLVECIKEIEQKEIISSQNEPNKFKWIEFNQLPPILQIDLIRFETNLSSEVGYKKLNTPVKFPEELDFHDTKYDLYGILSHAGSNSGGHYISYVRHFPSNQWCSYNDTVVQSNLSIKSILNSNDTKRFAYVIFYVRRDQIDRLFDKSQIPQQLDEIVKSLIVDKNQESQNKDATKFNFILEEDELNNEFSNKSIAYSPKDLTISTKDTKMNLYKRVAELFDKKVDEIRLWTTNKYGIDRSLVDKSPFSKIGGISNNGHNFIFVQNKKENEFVYPGSNIIDFSTSRIQYGMYFIKFFDLRMDIPIHYMGTIVTSYEGPMKTPEISKLLGFPEWTKYHYFIQLNQLAIRKIPSDKTFRSNGLNSGSIITVQIDFESTEKESNLSKEELMNYAPFDLSKSTSFKDIKLNSTHPIIEEKASKKVTINEVDNSNDSLPDYIVPFNKYRADNYIASRYFMKHVTVFDCQEKSKPLFTINFPITIELEELTKAIRNIKGYSNKCIIKLFSKKENSDGPSDTFINNEIYLNPFNDNRLYFLHWKKVIDMAGKLICRMEIADDGYNVGCTKFVICIRRPTPLELLITSQEFVKGFPKHILPYGKLNNNIKTGKKTNNIYSAMPQQMNFHKKKSPPVRTNSSTISKHNQPPRCYEVRDFTIFKEYMLTDQIDLTYRTIRFAAFISPSVGEIAVKVYQAKINEQNLLVCFRDPFYMNVKLNSTLKEFKEKVIQKVTNVNEEQLNNVKIEIWHRQKSKNESEKYRDFYRTAKKSSGTFITKDDDKLIGLTEQSIIYIIYD